MECYSAIKSKIMPFATTWMNLEIITLSEVSQTERQTSCGITYRQNLFKMIQMNLFTKQKHRLKRTNLWLPGGKEVGDRLEVLD